MLTVGTVFSGIGSVVQIFFANYDIDDKRWFDDIADVDGKKYILEDYRLGTS